MIQVLLIYTQNVDVKINHTLRLRSPWTEECSEHHTYVVKNREVYEQTTKG